MSSSSITWRMREERGCPCQTPGDSYPLPERFPDGTNFHWKTLKWKLTSFPRQFRHVSFHLQLSRIWEYLQGIISTANSMREKGWKWKLSITSFFFPFSFHDFFCVFWKFSNFSIKFSSVFAPSAAGKERKNCYEKEKGEIASDTSSIHTRISFLCNCSEISSTFHTTCQLNSAENVNTNNGKWVQTTSAIKPNRHVIAGCGAVADTLHTSSWVVSLCQCVTMLKIQ